MCDNFNDQNLLRHSRSVYQGRLHGNNVAIRLLQSAGSHSQAQAALQQWLDRVCPLSHPHVLPIIGACLHPAALICPLMQVGLSPS